MVPLRNLLTICQLLVVGCRGWTLMDQTRSTRTFSTHLAMVSSTPPQKQQSKAAAAAATTTPLPVYPTQRGTTTDARKIIATGKGREHLQAVRINHILFASEDLAQATLYQLRTGATMDLPTKGSNNNNNNSTTFTPTNTVTNSMDAPSFSEMARMVSACTETRDKGGQVGWMQVQERPTNENTDDNPDETEDNPNQHLDEILPQQARQQILHISTKPGDIFLVTSHRGYHLVQIVDVLANVQQMAQTYRNVKFRSSKLTSELLNTKQHDKEHGLTYKMETMGCQMNLADSERMEGQLQSLGIQPFQDDDNTGKNKKKPDIVVLNTCSIRDHAEQKVYSYIGPYAKRKREGEEVTIIVAGCVAQQEGEALLRRAPEIDLVMGPQYANRIGDLLEDVANGNQVVATEATHIMEDSTKPRRQSTVVAWVNVIYGCNERCTFCIVPTTRGIEQSRPVESIVQEVTDLVENQGFKEVTLLGQNIDAYGRDMVPKRKFSDLIRIIGSTPGLKRLRFVTSHPRYMSLGVVDAVAETDTACECFHIPFQSGSNEILAAMGRGHTREKYLHIVSRIRSRIPDAAITADVIVGFPGETEEQFQETLSLMEEVVFDSVNTAAYSPRPNTPAAVFDNQISEEVKQDRLQRINALNKEHAARRRARMMGRVVEVLIEERNIRVPTQVMGRSRHGYIVYCDGDIDELRGQVVMVKIETCQTYHLAGSIVE